MDQIKCPACEAPNPVSADKCIQCQADLSALKSVINTANRHYNQAIQFAKDSRNDDAIRELSTAIELWGDNPNYYNLLGTCHANKGIFTEATAAWEKSLALAPTAQKAHKNIEQVKKLEMDKQPPPAAGPGSRLGFILAGVFLLIAIAGVGSAIYIKTSNSSQIDGLLTKNAELSSATDELKSVTEDRDSLKTQYENASSALIEAESTVTQLQQTLELSNSERDANFVPRKDHEREVATLKNQNQQKTDQLQGELEKLRSRQGTEQVNLAQRVKDLEGEKAAQIVQIEQLQATADNLNRQIGEVQNQLAKARSNNSELTEARQALTESLNKAEAERNQLSGQVVLLQQTRERMALNDTLATHAIQSMMAHEYDNGIAKLEEILQSDSGNHMAQVLLPEVRRLNDEWNNPVNMALRAQEGQAETTDPEKLRRELAQGRVQASKSLLAQLDFVGAEKAASLAVQLQPEDAGILAHADKVRAQAAVHEEEMHVVTQQVHDALQQERVFEARGILESNYSRFPHDEPYLSLMAHVDRQAIERDAELTEKAETARALLAAEDFDAANAVIAEVLDVNPNNLVAAGLRDELGRARDNARGRRIAELLRAANESMLQGGYQRAQDYVNQLLELDPQNKNGLRLANELKSKVPAGNI